MTTPPLYMSKRGTKEEFSQVTEDLRPELQVCPLAPHPHSIPTGVGLSNHSPAPSPRHLLLPQLLLLPHQGSNALPG